MDHACPAQVPQAHHFRHLWVSQGLMGRQGNTLTCAGAPSKALASALQHLGQLAVPCQGGGTLPTRTSQVQPLWCDGQNPSGVMVKNLSGKAFQGNFLSLVGRRRHLTACEGDRSQKALATARPLPGHPSPTAAPRPLGALTRPGTGISSKEKMFSTSRSCSDKAVGTAEPEPCSCVAPLAPALWGCTAQPPETEAGKHVVGVHVPSLAED